MGIFEKFVNAVSEAIDKYELEKNQKNKTINPQRKKDIETLRKILEQDDSNISAVKMRRQIVDYLNKMSVTFAAFLWSIFDSPLKKNITVVLLQYPESYLFDEEHIEVKRWAKLIGTAEDGTNLYKKIDQLEDVNVQLIKSNTEALALNKSTDETLKKIEEKCQQLVKKNGELQQEVDDLQDKLKVTIKNHNEYIQQQEKIIEKLKLALDEKDKAIKKLQEDKTEFEKELERNKSAAKQIKKEFDKLDEKCDSLEKSLEESLEFIYSCRQMLINKGATNIELQTFDEQLDFIKERIYERCESQYKSSVNNSL